MNTECETCRRGCGCASGDRGCGHFACGAATTEATCPGATTVRAAVVAENERFRVAMTRPEATPEQAARWKRQHSDGYRAGRGDARARSQRMALVDVPAELPGETGAQYVARCLPDAWAIGYTRGYTWECAHQPA